MNNTMINNFSRKGDVFLKNSINAKKKILRNRCKDIREQMTEEYVVASSSAIQDAVLASEEYRNAKTIFCYMNYGKEVITDGIIRQALADGKTVCVPLCLDQEYGNHIMEAKEYSEGAELVPGAFGIMEPTPDAPSVAKADIDLAIIPCVACDARGNRLGHGAGYYDRYLAGTAFCKMALCFDQLLLTNVATLDDDVSMDAVITENGRIYG